MELFPLNDYTLLPDLSQFAEVAVDVETTGLDWHKEDVVFGVAISAQGPEAVHSWAFDVREPGMAQLVVDALSTAKALVNHNLKFDLHMLRKLGFEPAKGVPLRCTMIQAALLNEHLMAYDLDTLAKKYLKREKMTSIYADLAEMYGGAPTKKEQAPRLKDAPFKLWSEYAMRDTELALALDQWQLPELRRQELMTVHALEMALLPAIVRMEAGGVRIDRDRAEAAVPVVTEQIEDARKRLKDIVGYEINSNSPKQLAELFKPIERADGWWELCDGTLTMSTDSGKAACLDKNCLQEMKHPAAAVILEIRNHLRIRDTFLLGHVLGSEVNGRVHTNLNQTRAEKDDGGIMGAGPGRMSSTTPNLQQISKRNKKSMELIRPIFLPDEGMEWLRIDLSQIDFRVMVSYLNNPEIIAQYYAEPRYVENANGKRFAVAGPDTDFHQMVAEKTGLPRDPTYGIRGYAKGVNLGLMMGMGQGRLAQEVGLPFYLEKQPDGRIFKKSGPEGIALFEHYHRQMPGIRELLKKAKGRADEVGYIRTILGRRCRFPRGIGTFKAGPYIFQGGAAELMKAKLVDLDALMPEVASRLMFPVHDEANISVPIGARENGVAQRIQEVYEDNTRLVRLRIPIRSDCKVGNNWYDAS